MRKMHDPAGAGSLPAEGTLSLSLALSESLVPLSRYSQRRHRPLPAFFERWSWPVWRLWDQTSGQTYTPLGYSQHSSLAPDFSKSGTGTGERPPPPPIGDEGPVPVPGQIASRLRHARVRVLMCVKFNKKKQKRQKENEKENEFSFVFATLCDVDDSQLARYSVRIPRFCSVSSCLQFLLCSQPLHANFQGFSARILTAPE
jgi:hypothetical protein